MRRFSTHVHPCIPEGGGQLKTLYTKTEKGENNLSTTVNCNMLKLIFITFSKMLIVLIISSLFLPHPVECIKCLHYIFQSKSTALHISVQP